MFVSDWSFHNRMDPNGFVYVPSFCGGMAWVSTQGKRNSESAFEGILEMNGSHGHHDTSLSNGPFPPNSAKGIHKYIGI